MRQHPRRAVEQTRLSADRLDILQHSQRNAMCLRRVAELATAAARVGRRSARSIPADALIHGLAASSATSVASLAYGEMTRGYAPLRPSSVARCAWRTASGCEGSTPENTTP